MTILLAACLVYLAALAAIAIGQRRLLYFPNAAATAPASVGLPNVEVRHLATDDGETLLAWYVPPSPGKSLILYFHGNGDGLAARNIRFQQLTAAGLGLLAVEYRGYGGSTGSPSEQGFRRDAEAAYGEALALGAPPERIVAMGESLGTGVAIGLAARHRIGALVLDSPYSSVVDIAAARFWMFPARLLLIDAFRSDEEIGLVTVPVLMVHGTADAAIPIRFGDKLFALANEPKRFIRVEGGGHLALGSAIPQVLRWIDQTMAGS